MQPPSQWEWLAWSQQQLTETFAEVLNTPNTFAEVLSRKARLSTKVVKTYDWTYDWLSSVEIHTGKDHQASE